MSRRTYTRLTDQELDQKLSQTKRSFNALQDHYLIWLESTKVKSDLPWLELKRGHTATDWNSIEEDLNHA